MSGGLDPGSWSHQKKVEEGLPPLLLLLCCIENRWGGPIPPCSHQKGRGGATPSTLSQQKNKKMAGAPFAPAMPFPFMLKMAREGVDPPGDEPALCITLYLCESVEFEESTSGRCAVKVTSSTSLVCWCLQVFLSKPV